MVIAATANPGQINWATIIPLAVQLLYVLIPLVAAWVGLAIKAWLDAHTTGQTQQTLEKIAATAVQAVEQVFAGQESTLQTQKAKFNTAANMLVETATQQLHLTLSDEQIKALIESAVHALNAGAVEMVSGAAPLLPASEGLSNNVRLDQFKQDVLDAANTTVPRLVQSTLAGMLGAAVAQAPQQQPSSPQSTQPQGQQTVGQVSSAPQPDVVVQPGVSVGLAGQPTAPQGAPQPPTQS